MKRKRKGERMKKKNSREEMTERPDRSASHVELHRSYGVQRRLRPWKEKIEIGFYKIFLFWVLGILSLAAILAIVNFWLYYPEIWIKLLLSLLIGGFVFVRLTRTVRKRRGFIRRLKRSCKSYGYTLSAKQGVFRSMIWSGNREDMVLTTQTCEYRIRFLTVRKYRSTLYLEGEELLRLVKRPLNSRFTDIFDFRPRAKYYPLEFRTEDECASETKKLICRVLLVNPVCEEIRYKKKDGGYETTGNGGTHFGYTVYTAGGFLNTLKQDT